MYELSGAAYAQEKSDKTKITVKGYKQNDKRSATVTIPAWYYRLIVYC